MQHAIFQRLHRLGVTSFLGAEGQLCPGTPVVLLVPWDASGAVVVRLAGGLQGCNQDASPPHVARRCDVNGMKVCMLYALCLNLAIR